MDYNVEHFVLAYPVGYLKQAACLFIYLFKMKRIFSFWKGLSILHNNIIFFDYIADKQYIVHKLDFLAQLWHIVGRKTNK